MISSASLPDFQLLTSSTTFAITNRVICEDLYNGLNFGFASPYLQSVQVVLDRESYESEYVMTPNYRHDNIQNQTVNQIERHAECL